jgi:hypothetical protein
VSHFDVHFHAKLVGDCPGDVFWEKPWEEIDTDHDDDMLGRVCHARVIISVQADDAAKAIVTATQQVPPTGWENAAWVSLSIHMVRADIIYPVPITLQAAEALLRYESASNALSIAMARYFGAKEVGRARWMVPWLSSEVPYLNGVYGLTTDFAHAFMLIEHCKPGIFIALGHRALDLMDADGIASPTQFARYLLLALIVTEMGVAEQTT